MANQEVKKMLPYNLQFFGGSDDGGAADDNSGKKGDSGSEGETDDDSEDEDDSDDDEGGKTFTQSEVTAMMTAEKKKGKRSAYKSLGFKDEKEAQKAMAGYREYLESQKTEEDKRSEKQKELEDSKSDAEKRAEMAESKLACVMAGVNKDSIDDVLAIALAKVSDEEDLEDVLEAMKSQKRYKGFFSNSEEDDSNDEGSKDGTGRNPGKKKKPAVPENYGKTLAEKRLQAKGSGEGKKSSYFSGS